jgi:Cu+-exporting ATPase
MTVIDPICKMQIDENTAAGKSAYNGKTFYFCAISCKRKFDNNPEKYSSQDNLPPIHMEEK